MIRPGCCTLAACLAALALVSLPGVCSAQSDAPAWARLFDQGEADASLKGLHAPRGIKLEIASAEPLANGLRDVVFGDDGRLYLLDAEGSVQALLDGDGDGLFEKSEALAANLPQPLGLLVRDGWLYYASGDRLLRRRPSDEKLLSEARANAENKSGPPTSLTADKRWIEQQLASGLDASEAARSGGLALGLDGWLLVAHGGVNRLESWDGSRAAVLASGAVFRTRPDGSQVQELARGMQSPRGGPTGNAFGNLFQTETCDAGTRLIHLLEGADYGWRSDLKSSRLDRPGTLLTLPLADLKEPGGALCYWGQAFPKFFQGLLLIPAPQSHAVQGVALQPAGCTFAIEQQFDLLKSDDPRFRPTHVVRGPDGAIYVAADRLYRLTWSGTATQPAIAIEPASPTPPEPPLADLLKAAADNTVPAEARAAALAAACLRWEASVYDTCLALLSDEQPQIARMAVEALADHLPEKPDAQQELAGKMQERLLRGQLPVRRSLYLALGKLGTRLDTVPEWIFEASSVTPDVARDRHLFQAHARAAEMPQGWATELMIANLEVALFDPNAEPQERHRLKLFVVATAEAMRSRELANFLDKAIRDERDYFSKLDAPLQARLLTAYGNVVVDPPIAADAAAAWLEKHPTAAPQVQLAVWTALATVGTSRPEPVVLLVKGVLAAKFDESLRPHMIAALQRHVVEGKPGEIEALLMRLKQSQ